MQILKISGMHKTPVVFKPFPVSFKHLSLRFLHVKSSLQNFIWHEEYASVVYLKLYLENLRNAGCSIINPAFLRFSERSVGVNVLAKQAVGLRRRKTLSSTHSSRNHTLQHTMIHRNVENRCVISRFENRCVISRSNNLIEVYVTKSEIRRVSTN